MDTNNVSVGTSLQQIIDDTPRFLVFFSRQLNVA